MNRVGVTRCDSPGRSMAVSARALCGVSGKPDGRPHRPPIYQESNRKTPLILWAFDVAMGRSTIEGLWRASRPSAYLLQTMEIMCFRRSRRGQVPKRGHEAGLIFGAAFGYRGGHADFRHGLNSRNHHVDAKDALEILCRMLRPQLCDS